MDVNQTLESIGSTDLNGVWYYISFIPKFLTEKITVLLNDNGLTVTERWTSGLLILISLILVFISIKLLQKANWLIKGLILILALLLLAGLFLVPSW